MAWKGLHLSRPACLALAQSQIAVRIDDEEEIRLPVEDVAWVVIDSPQVTLTAALVSACMDAGIALIFTDRRHTPSGVALPFHRHFKQGGVARTQMAISLPLKKRLWQTIVRAKIANQAAALAAMNRDGAKLLLELVRHVGSGDPENVEARAARAYWSSMWKDFRREDDADLRNKALNYGYAVVRAGVARAIVASGLLPAFGLQHANGANAFNLADDLFEPFRPFVDVLVCETVDAAVRIEDELTLGQRRTLAAGLNRSCGVEGEATTLLVAAERSAESLVRAMETGSPDELILPEFSYRAAQ